jgi:COP9 signalosome complex subunit 12
MAFQNFRLQLVQAIQSESGPTLAYLLRPTSPHGKEIVKELRNPTVSLINHAELVCVMTSHLNEACWRFE